jgi:hypothetical protein
LFLSTNIAGVLRGEKSRFQLFGDTVNTAARIESTGKKNRVHLSKETADLLISAKKADWVKPRQDTVSVKGKGQLQTYWLLQNSDRPASVRPPSQGTFFSKDVVVMDDDPDHTLVSVGNQSHISCFTDEATDKSGEGARIAQLVDFNTKVLLQLLRKMQAMRKTTLKQAIPKTLPA